MGNTTEPISRSHSISSSKRPGAALNRRTHGLSASDRTDGLMAVDAGVSRLRLRIERSRQFDLPGERARFL